MLFKSHRHHSMVMEADFFVGLLLSYFFLFPCIECIKYDGTMTAIWKWWLCGDELQCSSVNFLRHANETMHPNSITSILTSVMKVFFSLLSCCCWFFFSLLGSIFDENVHRIMNQPHYLFKNISEVFGALFSHCAIEN